MAWRARVAAMMAVAVAGVLALAWAYPYGGGAKPAALDQAGLVVLWGLPLAKLVFHLAAAGTIGALALATFALSPIDAAQNKTLRAAGISAAIWALAAAVFSLFNFHNIVNKPLSAGSLGAGFASFLTSGLGRPGALSVAIAVTVSLLCFTIRGVPMALVTALLAFAGLVPLVLTSHASGGADHVESTTAVVLHVCAVAVWLGGLLVLVMLRPALPAGRLNVVVRRFSTLALISFIVVGISGLLSARAGLGSLDQLGTPYGRIVLAKAVAFILLGIVGTVHRQWILSRLDREPDRGARHFTVLVVAELVVLGAASGMAAALARTEVPSLTAAAAEPPPEPGVWAYITQWEPDPLWLLLCVFGAFLYLAGVRRIRLAGGSWPMWRTLFWLAGIAVLFTVTNGGIHVYQEFLFNAHVLTQMLLTAFVPLLLVPGAPITLAERTIRSRTDGSTGAREMIRSAVRPVLTAATSAPYVPALVIALSLNAFYYTPLLGLAALTQLGFSAMTLLALLSGCLFTAAMTGAVQGDHLHARRWRLVVLAVTAGVYAVYGRALSAQAAELEQPWYFAVGQPWGAPDAASPELGGPVMWAIAAATLAVIALMALLPPTPRDQASDPGGKPAPRSAKHSANPKRAVRP